MSKKNVLDSMKVEKPCPADWEQMTGNDQVRFCTHCSESVNNISKMTQKEAIRLVRKSNGSLCIRYYTNPVTQKPMFVENFIQITRRAPRLAAGVMTASLSLATLAYSQTQSPPQPDPPVAEQTNKQDPPINGDVPVNHVWDGPPVAVGGVMMMRVEYKGLLAQAVAKDNLNEVRNLIASGEDVNGREEDKTTPLFIAVENGNLEMTELLLNFGAKVNARNSTRETALMKLDDEASKELVELLIRNGAKVDLKDASGNTALILAAQAAKPEVVQALIDAGADVNEKNEEGQTALLNAAYADDIEAVRILLNAGADVNAKNVEGETAFDKTSEKEIEDLLVSHGAIPTIKTDETVADNEKDN
jgi:hypothetical protein